MDNKLKEFADKFNISVAAMLTYDAYRWHWNCIVLAKGESLFIAEYPTVIGIGKPATLVDAIRVMAMSVKNLGPLLKYQKISITKNGYAKIVIERIKNFLGDAAYRELEEIASGEILF